MVQRAAIGRITFEPMSGFAGAIRKVGAMFDGSRGKPFLEGVDLITAVMTPLEAGFCHVTLGASTHRSRRGYVGGGSAVAVAVAAIAGGAVVLGMGPILGVVGVAAGMFGGLEIAQLFPQDLEPCAARPRTPARRSGAPPQRRRAETSWTAGPRHSPGACEEVRSIHDTICAGQLHPSRRMLPDDDASAVPAGAKRTHRRGGVAGGRRRCAHSRWPSTRTRFRCAGPKPG